MSTPKIQNNEEKKRVNREQWLAIAHEAIAAVGLTVVQNKKSYKSFRDKERFFIQECMYPDGSHVMVKVSAPNPVERVILKKEAYWYKHIQELAKEAQKKGIVIPIRFPKVVDIFTYKDHAVMITSYVVDDWKGFKNLSQEEREDIIVTIIDSMQKLPIPEEELALPSHERLIPVITAFDYQVRAKRYLGELVDTGHVEEKDSRKMIALMEEYAATIDSFPLKLDHGDMHSGNFFYSKDPQTGEDIITLFDLELMSIRPLFSMAAAAANFFDLAALANMHPERDNYPSVLTDVPLFNTLFSASSMIHKIEETFVMNERKKKDAMLVYRLLRIDDCYARLADAVYESHLFKQELNNVEVDSYKKILSEQLAYIKGERN